MLSQNTNAALSPVTSPPSTPDASPEISLQAHPLNPPALALPNPVPQTAIAAAGIAVIAVILAITIRLWL